MTEPIIEPRRELLPSGNYDMIVCGAGPAGVCAALAAARSGIRTLLVEGGGCLGGVWTSGILCMIHDVASKAGLMSELRARLERMEAIRYRFGGPNFTYDVEAMKAVLEEMCGEAGVEVRLHTRVVDAVASGGRLGAIVTESPSGREAFVADYFVDATGNGDLAARAGCRFEMGHPDSGKVQPATLMAVFSGLPESALTAERHYNRYGRVEPGVASGEKQGLLETFRSAGYFASNDAPTVFPLPHPGLYGCMFNHEFDVRCDSAEAITAATIRARKELLRAVQAVWKLPEWKELRLIVTADHIGLREGRRINGLYRLRAEDIVAGRRFDDGVCLVNFSVDVHSLEPGVYQARSFTDGIKARPYHVPYRALVSSDYANLAMAGRCISGDFYAHASYRVTGNAVAMGEAVGAAAGLARRSGRTFAELDGRLVSDEMRRRGYEL
ncbi:FAD-dependent oxidoreductase [Cohnella fermenti]|uniref:FAD-dependent oxidoreductase n=1 Tax=Cohnella fermenti TaxID=2565925 RepID=UPI001454E22B|nr:FAD-dependent oxidoreductase [Cohnella fermenti]